MNKREKSGKTTNRFKEARIKIGLFGVPRRIEERNGTMKNKRHNNDGKNAKGLAIASAIGITAVAASLVAVYGSTAKRLIPTNSSPESLFSVSSSKSTSDIPANNSVSGVPKDSASSSSSKPDKSSSEAEPANRPVTIKAGNILPVEGEIDKPFSNGELVKSETLGVWKTHDGADILCELGTDVKSMSEGVVKEIRDDPLLGVCVTVEQTNGLEVYYCGLAKELCVKAGQQVKQGEILGKTSDTNVSEAIQKPHLHLAVKENGKWIDPLSVVGKNGG